MLDNQSVATFILGSAFIGSILYLDRMQERTPVRREAFGNGPQRAMRGTQAPSQPMRKPSQPSQPYPTNPSMYNNPPYGSNGPFAGPSGAIPQAQANVNLNASGDQLLDYQLYQ